MIHHSRKRFGQHFLRDPETIGRTLDAIGPTPQDHIVEIGPGRGALTRNLLTASGQLDAIELDRDLIEPLKRSCKNRGELNVYNADALKFSICRLVKSGQRLRIVGNLPYNISTPLIFHLLDQSGCIEDMHLMLQKEVVARMSASPGNRVYGRLSVMLQTHARVTPLFDIGPAAFKPTPKVESSFVRLCPYRQSPFRIEDAALFDRLVRQAFSQRRKTLRNALRDYISSDTMLTLAIDPGLRAEQLSVEDFVKLANAAGKIQV